jgi:hypothetical protein
LGLTISVLKELELLGELVVVPLLLSQVEYLLLEVLHEELLMLCARAANWLNLEGYLRLNGDLQGKVAVETFYCYTFKL